MPVENKNNLLIALILLITFVVFLPSLNNSFTNWDDNLYVTDNLDIRDISLNNLKKICSNSYVGNYQPVTIFSYAIDFAIGELNSKVYHWSNLIYHLLNTTLVFFLIRLLTGSIVAGFVTSLLFGIHPLHVESVAWISGRKDLLFTGFYLGSLMFYAKYLEENSSKRSYLISIVLFVFSLLSKGTAVTLPVILILIDLFKGKKFEKRLLTDKIPFFALSILFGLIAINSQESLGKAVEVNATLTGLDSFFIGCYGFMMYFVKLVVPYKLACFYPYPIKVDDSLPMIFYISAPISLGILGLMIYLAKKHKTVLFGIGFFLVNIFLLLQFFPIGGAVMADRYSYLSFIGLFFIVGHFGDQLFHNNKYKTLGLILFSLMTLGFSYISFQRCKIWNNSAVLWSDVINKYPEASGAYNNRGLYYFLEKNDLNMAFADFKNCVEIDPGNFKALTSIGLIHYSNKNYKEAINFYNKSISVNNDYADAYCNRAIVYSILKNYDNAEKDYKKAIELNPSDPQNFLNRAIIYTDQRQFEKALKDYNQAIFIKRDYSKAYYNRAYMYLLNNKFQDAISDLNTSIQIDPNFGLSYYYRSMAYFELLQYELALTDALKAKTMGIMMEDKYLYMIKEAIEDIQN